ncbi:MAG: phenylacetate-CoA ligase [Chlamydiales bacterium]|jgi:phenylacetate-CoA ligase
MKPTSWTRLAQTPAVDIKRLQDKLLQRFVREELYPFSGFYRRMFDDAGVSPRDIRSVGDLRRLPFTTKQDLIDAQLDPQRTKDFILIPTPAAIREHWGFLRKFALVTGGPRSREALRRAYTPSFLTFTTGRSTEPVSFTYTPHDLEILSTVGGRMLDVHGITDPSARILNAFPFAPHLAFWQATFCGFETGRMMVPTGGGKVMGTAGNLRLLERIKSNALIATPGFAYHLMRRAREEGADLSHMKHVVLGAEKVTPGLKRKMAECLEACGARDVVISGTYGFTEARMAFSECPTDHDTTPGYHIYPDLVVIEIIDPETLEPVGEGEDGEIVLTVLAGHGSVICRYRTGDLAIGGMTWEPCPHCGRTVPRVSSELLRVSDRHTLNLTKIKGTLVDLSSIGTVLSDRPDIEEWQVVLTKKDDDPYGLDQFELKLALRAGTDPGQAEKQIREQLTQATEVSPSKVSLHSTTEMLEFLGMETEMKEKRYVDLRPK